METLVNVLATLVQHKKAFLAGAGALVVVLLLSAVLGGSGEEQLIDQYFKAFEQDDTEAVLDLFYEPIAELEQSAQMVGETSWLKSVDKFYNRYGSEIVRRETVSIDAFDKDLVAFITRSISVERPKTRALMKILSTSIRSFTPASTSRVPRSRRAVRSPWRSRTAMDGTIPYTSTASGSRVTGICTL